MTDIDAEVLIDARGVGKIFANGVVGLKNVSLRVNRGAVACIIGPSASGTSTLLRTLTALETNSAAAIKGPRLSVHIATAHPHPHPTPVGHGIPAFNLSLP